jgi:catechol 2,3-dioxygenase-like lactoylglutathione lyase family enzyme
MAKPLEFRFDHVHVYASDFAESERWFVDKLGAEVMDRRDAGGTKSAFLRLGDRMVIVRGPSPGETLAPAEAGHFGNDHFGLQVQNLAETAAELKARGVKFTMEPNEFRPGVHIAFIEGPDRVSIEILQRDA